MGEGKAENMDQIHNMGKKSTKYMEYQAMRAPLVDRTACLYFRDFNPKPVGDSVFNKELAENFKGGHRLASTPSFGLTSSYADNFVDLSPKQRRSAKVKSQGPKKLLTQTLGGTGDFLEPVSMSHSKHSPLAKAKSAVTLHPHPNLTCAGH